MATRLSWNDLTSAVQAKTAYLAMLAAFAGIAATGVGVAVDGTAQLLLLALGSTLLTSSVFSCVSESMLRLDTVDAVGDRLDELEVRILETVSGGTGHEVVELVSNRREVDFAEFARTAAGDLKIVGFSANDILSAPNSDRLGTSLKAGRIRSIAVVLLDPNSDTARMRSSQPAYRYAEAMGEKTRSVVSELRELRSIAAELPGTPSVKLHFTREPVTLSVVADDERVVVTPVVRTKTGGTSPTFIFKRNSPDPIWYASYVEHLDSLIVATPATQL